MIEVRSSVQESERLSLELEWMAGISLSEVIEEGRGCSMQKCESIYGAKEQRRFQSIIRRVNLLRLITVGLQE